MPTGGSGNRKDELIVLEANSPQAGVVQSIVYIHDAHSASTSLRCAAARMSAMVSAIQAVRAPGTRQRLSRYAGTSASLPKQPPYPWGREIKSTQHEDRHC